MTELPHPASSRPLIWLDIDGVVKANRSPDHSYRGYRRVVISDAQWSGEVLYRTAVVRAVNRAAASGIEVRWISMWGGNARRLLGPALGFADFAVATAIASEHGVPELGARSVQWWKVQAMEQASAAEPERPMLWIDDSMSADLLQHWKIPARLSLLTVAGHRGLNRRDLAVLARWCRHPQQQILPTGATGHPAGITRSRP